MFGGKKADPRKQVRQQQRQLTHVQRDIDRDYTALERQEKQIQNEIQKAAKMGDKQTATVSDRYIYLKMRIKIK